MAAHPENAPVERRAAPDGPVGGSARVLVPGRRALTLGVVLVVTVVATEALAVATVMPVVEDELGDVELYGWVFAGFFLASVLGIVVAGRVADRVALVVPFVAGLVLFCAGLVVGGSAPSMGVLVAGRVLQGFGAGALPTAAYVAIGRAYTPAQRPRMFAVLSTAWILPGALGPGLAGFTAEVASWRWVFLGLLPLAVGCGSVAAVAMARQVPPPSPAAAAGTRPSAWWALLLVTGAGALLAAGFAPAVWIGTGLVAVGVGVGLPAYRRLVLPGAARARPGPPAAVATMGVFTFAFFAADAYVPYALFQLRDVRPAVVGVVATSATLCWSAAAWVQERRVRRTGPRPLVATGLALVAAGVLGLAAVAVTGLPVALAVASWGLAGLGAGLTVGPLGAAVFVGVPAGTEGAASSSLQLTETLGIALGSGFGGVVVAVGAGAGWALSATVLAVFVPAATVAALGTLLARRLPPSVVDDRLPTPRT